MVVNSVPNERRNEQTNLAVVERICDLVDQAAPGPTSRRELITYVADRPGHDQRYAIDATKLESELGWRAREDFASGLARTVGWYLATPQWWRPLRDGVYQGERLGLVGRSDASGSRQTVAAAQAVAL